jgi:hypothetical protein
MCDDGQITNSERRKGKSMTNKNKATKQLSKALAVLLTLGSLLGVTGAPAFADFYDRDLNVEVTAIVEDEPETCNEESTPPLWTLGEVYYPSGSDNVDLNLTNDLDFKIDSSFTVGKTNGTCENSADVDPTGNVSLEVNDFDDTQIVVSWLDCGPDVDPCEAVDHLIGANLNGTLEVQDGTPVGVYYGKLRATWTPAS